jgi:hypothetical protein
MKRRSNMQNLESRNLAVATWAVFGVAGLLVESILRLGAVAFAGLRGGFGPTEWGALALTTALLAYFEGYRGFQCSFSPRVVERAFDLGHRSGPFRIALAPLYAMALFGGSRKELVRSWLLVGGIVVMVVVVRRLPTSWRCIVDGAVAVSMTWGLVAMGTRYFDRARTHFGSSTGHTYGTRARVSVRPSIPPA